MNDENTAPTDPSSRLYPLPYELARFGIAAPAHTVLAELLTFGDEPIGVARSLEHRRRYSQTLAELLGMTDQHPGITPDRAKELLAEYDARSAR